MEFLNRLITALFEVHPLHAMIVHFPIGLTGAAFLFILIAAVRRSDALEKAAFANIALAAFTVLLAGVTGLRDNANFYSGNAPNVEWKIGLAILLFLVTTLTAVVRWRKPDLMQKASAKGLYIAAYGISFALALVLGFLGGVILYGF